MAKRPEYTTEDFKIESDDAKILFGFVLEKKRMLKRMKRHAVALSFLAAAAGFLWGWLFFESPFSL